MTRKITDTVWATGKVIRKPNIQLSFVSYLLKGKKNVLIDTVPDKVAIKWWEEITAIVPYQELDALILNHSEEDHSGALPLVLSWRSDLPIYCTAVCKERLQQEYPYANFICVEDRSELQIGDFRFRFVHTPGLHWEDNMVTFFENERILFSNDLFGQYVGDDSLSDEAVPAEVVTAGLNTYFEKVFAASTATQQRVLADIRQLDFERIAPGHGVVLRKTVPDVLDIYLVRFLYSKFIQSGKRHLFLTGDRGSGKTTLFQKLLPLLSESAVPGITTWAVAMNGVFLKDNFSGDSVQIGMYVSGANGQSHKMEPIHQSFEQFGCRLLEQCLNSTSEWISIDEIGYLDASSERYCQNILKLLECKRVLAVLRKKDFPFLDALKARDDACVIDLDDPNIYQEQ